MSFSPGALKDFTSFRMAKRLKSSPDDPFAFSNLIEKGDCSGRFGSVTKDIMDLIERKNQAVKFLLARIEGRKDAPSEGTGETGEKNVVPGYGAAKHVVIIDSDDEERVESKESKSQGVMTQEVELEAKNEKGVDVGGVTQPLELGAKKEKYVFLGVEKDKKSSSIEGIPKEDQKNVTKSGVVKDVVIIESDDEQERDCRPVEQNPRELTGVQPTESKSQGVVPFLACSEGFKQAQNNSQGVVTRAVEVEAKNEKGICIGEVTQPLEQEAKNEKGMFLGLAVQSIQPCAKNDKGVSVEVVSLKLEAKKGKGVYVGVEEEHDNETENDDGRLGDIWTEMSLALECSKDAEEDVATDEQMQVGDDYCDHSFVLKDDLGYVCRICGLIERRIETIIDVQFNKAKRSTRTYISNYRSAQDQDSNEMVRVELSKEDLMTTDLTAHPRHIKQMKPHQVAGFNFLCSNLVADNPGGCILAHAPGSGKTFMIISFLQSFLAKYPHSRPLIVMPKGILPTWKKEFQTWQVEDLPLYDFYSVKADTRLQQLEVLRRWAEEKSILLLGYKQFTSIVCDDANENNNATASCQEILLKQPSILILDEGHTPRNEDTEVLQSLARVQTPRKVVLSGTLYQNHVKEVFNILNLVRPKFLRLDASRAIVRRIMSRVDITGAKKFFKAGSDQPFYDLVEHTIQKDKDFKRKVAVIQDLREMTSKVLHYYRGDFLDELPGLVDFTVVLNLSSCQKKEVQEIKKLAKFKRCSVGSAVYLHPKLKSFSEGSALKDDRMDELLENLDLADGVKAKFFLCLLGLCESAKEKLLVFSQYLPPLKFLEKLTTKIKGWVLGREMFMISGESSSDHREWSMEQFNKSNDAKVFFGSIKACGEGISLVGASRVIILDVHLNPSVTRQAIGRAFRPGQKKKVFVYRLVADDSPEEEDHSTCFRKEVTAKMWFEWNEHSGYRKFEVETVDLKDCNDSFLESLLLREDVTALYRR